MVNHSDKNTPLIRYANHLGRSSEHDNANELPVLLEHQSNLPVAVGSAYLARYVDQGMKPKAMQFAESMQNGLKIYLQNVVWMDAGAKGDVKNIVNKMGFAVSFPDELQNTETVNKMYEELILNDSDLYFQMKMTINRFTTEFDFKRLKQKYEKIEWYFLGNIFDYDVEYTPEGVLRIPASLLQRRMYAENRPYYLNFGALGWLIGREFPDDFINEGMGPDLSSNKSAQSLDAKSRKFDQQKKCLINQYDQYVFAALNKKVSGEKTFKNNFADNGGLKIAYQGYKKWVFESEEDKKLPGFHHYTNDQMFWIGAATLWCTSYRLEKYKDRMDDSSWAPGEFRVKGSFSNNAEFAEDFECPEDSPMNPKEKCNI